MARDDGLVRLFHFSDDPAIACFVPHVPASNPGQSPAVWAIDEQHEAAYWFPRDCPRVTVWCDRRDRRAKFQNDFGTSSARVQAIERGQLAAMGAAHLHRYELPIEAFEPWAEADGQWICRVPVEPIRVAPFGNLIGRHREAGIDLRVLDSLWDLHDRVATGRWPFSIIRMSEAVPRAE